MDLCASVQRNQQDILQLWSDFSQQAAVARGFGGAAPLDTMEQYLTALASRPGAVDDPTRQSLLENHIASRLRFGFELAEIIAEVALLGHCVAQIWAALPAQERPGPLQVQEFYARLQCDTNRITALFTHHMLEDEQREKRFRRLIRGVAEDALVPNHCPLHLRYPEVLGLVQQTMGAESVTLLLNDADSAELSLAASVGPAEAVPKDTLTARLGPPERPLGVLVVATLPDRTFSARERRRLEALAEQLTFHLSSARLIAQLSSTIEELQREKGLRELFVAVLAHDLRGPLSAAKLAAHLLARADALEECERDQVSTTVDRNIDRMDRMIQDLLDVSRVRAGQPLPLLLAACDLGSLAAEVVDEIRPLYNNPFQCQAQPEVVGIWSGDDLRRALWNLASNAAKYGQKGGTITVVVERTPAGARVSVHNNGPAISPADQAQLFAPFSRAQGAETRGWGLGLALVRTCVEAHGGCANVTSNSALGTTFSLELPLDSTPYCTTAASQKQSRNCPAA